MDKTYKDILSKIIKTPVHEGGKEEKGKGKKKEAQEPEQEKRKGLRKTGDEEIGLKKALFIYILK